MVEPLEQPHRALLVGLALRRVLADDVDGAQVAVLHGLEHPGQVQPRLRRHGHAPGRFERRAHRCVLERLEARQPVRDRSHVAAALHVVLSA